MKAGEAASSNLACRMAGMAKAMRLCGNSSVKKRGPLVPTGSDTGMAGGRDTSSVNEAGHESPALCSMIPPGLNFAVARPQA